jgi:hypothetical protein
MPVLLSTRTTNGSMCFNGVRTATPKAHATAHSHPAAATHHAIAALRLNPADRSASQESASRKYSCRSSDVVMDLSAASLPPT